MGGILSLTAPPCRIPMFHPPRFQHSLLLKCRQISCDPPHLPCFRTHGCYAHLSSNCFLGSDWIMHHLRTQCMHLPHQCLISLYCHHHCMMACTSLCLQGVLYLQVIWMLTPQSLLSHHQHRPEGCFAHQQGFGHRYCRRLTDSMPCQLISLIFLTMFLDWVPSRGMVYNTGISMNGQICSPGAESGPHHLFYWH